MYCPKCGKQVPDDANFCTNCGIRLHAIVDTTAEKDVVSNDEKSSTTSTPTTKKTRVSRYSSVRREARPTTSTPTTKKKLVSRAGSVRYCSGCGRQMSGYSRYGNICPSCGHRHAKPYNIGEKLCEVYANPRAETDFIIGSVGETVLFFLSLIGSIIVIIGLLLFIFSSKSL